MTNTESSKFPNQFAPQSEKNSPRYCKAYAEAFHTEAAYLPSEAALTRNNKNYKRYRQYARGEQSQLQYKELLGLKKAKDGQPPNTSFRNLNFEILKIAPKIRNVVVNKIVNQPFRMSAKAIDPKSISERRKYKTKLLEFIVNKEEIENFEKLTSIGLERPVPAGEIPPANAMEIDPFIDMNPKDITSMEVLDFITQNYHENDWTQLGKEVAGDLVDTGIGGTRQYIDVTNKIKIRRIIPENSVCNKCIYPDFRDLIRFGEYIQMTVSELKRVTKGAWGEKAYQEIANKVTNGSYSNTTENFYWRENSYSFAYDHENVTVFECLWISVDNEVHLEYTSESGNRRIKQMEHNYVPFRGDKSVNAGKGMTDDEYSAFTQGKKKIHRTEVKNVYTCSWVVDTDYVYNYGLMKNMLRPSSNWQETVLPVTLVSTDFISTIGLIEQPLDQVQLNYLQHQSHVQASKPPGIAIEKNALARIGKGGQAGKKWDPKEALIMFAETGNFVYDGYDQHGTPLQQKPFQDLPNGLSQGATDHLILMKQWIDVIRDIVGLNAMSEGQTPPERLGKEVANLSIGASDNALSHLTAAYKSVYERTARNVFYLLQNNVQRMDPDQLTESLGSESYKYFMLNRDLALKDMGIILEEGPNDKVREKISAILQLMVENKEIPGEDAIMIEMVDNPYRQVLMIRKHRLEREQLENAKQENLVRSQGEENTKTAIATEEEKRRTKQEEFDQKLREKQVQFDHEATEKEKDRIHEILLKKMDQTQALDDKDKDLITGYLEALLKAQVDIQKTKITAAMKPKATTKSK